MDKTFDMKGIEMLLNRHHAQSETSRLRSRSRSATAIMALLAASAWGCSDTAADAISAPSDSVPVELPELRALNQCSPEERELVKNVESELPASAPGVRPDRDLSAPGARLGVTTCDGQIVWIGANEKPAADGSRKVIAYASKSGDKQVGVIDMHATGT